MKHEAGIFMVLFKLDYCQMSDVAHKPLFGLHTLINPVIWDCNTFNTNGLKYTCVHRI